MKQHYFPGSLLIYHAGRMLALCMLLLAGPAMAQTTVSGVISTNTTYTVAGSPYLVTNNLLVQSGVTLTIQPGVTLQFAPGIYMQVDGELRAIGTPTDSIVFTGNSTALKDAWGGVRFTDMCRDYVQLTGSGCVMDYCIYENSGSQIPSTHRTIQIDGCRVLIAHSDIRNCWGDGIVVEALKPGAAVYLINNKIRSTGSMAVWAADNSWGVIKGNDFSGMQGIGNPVVQIGRAFFVDNHVHGNIVDSLTIRVIDTAIIVSNIIEDGRTALLLQGGDAHIVKCNTFHNNKINLGITCERHPLVMNNNFNDYVQWNVYWSESLYRGKYGSYNGCRLPPGSGTFAVINLDSNYWGGISSGKMDTSIWDFQDDFNMKAKISYAPSYSTPVSFTPANCSWMPSSAPLSVAGPAADAGIEFFPNPMQDHAYLKLRGAVLNEQYQVSITDMTGKVVKRLSVTGADMVRISRDGLPSGVYVCQIVTPDNQRYVTRVVLR